MEVICFFNSFVEVIVPASAQAADLHSKKEAWGVCSYRRPFLIQFNAMHTKTATTIDEQVIILKERNMVIPNETKAKEVLLDIGYYRLGFYWFPFEIGYPDKNKREHKFKENTTFDMALTLYYFDNDLRNILIPYLHRIEINLRTKIIYYVSNFYKNNPTWFADSRVINDHFIEYLPTCYSNIRKNKAIKQHHKKYSTDKYAPAWKTLEYMTFGDMLFLFENLKKEELRYKIALTYNITNLEVFENQMQIIRVIRNSCAHGHNLFDIHFPKSIKAGPFKEIRGDHRHNITGGLLLIRNILATISQNRANEFIQKIKQLISNPQLKEINPIISHIQI